MSDILLSHGYALKAQDGKGRMAYIPAHMTKVDHKKFEITTFIAQGNRAPVSTSLNAGNEVLDFDVALNAIDKLESFILELEIKVANNSQLTCPAWGFVKEIEFRVNNNADSSSNFKIYNDTIFLDTFSFGAEQRDLAWRDMLTPKGVLMDRNLPTGTYYVRLPLNSYLDQLKPYCRHITQDLQIRLTFNNDVDVSGTSTDLTLQNITLYVQSERLSQKELDNFKKELHGPAAKSLVGTCVEYQKIVDRSISWTASTAHDIDLSSLKDVASPYLFLLFKPTTSVDIGTTVYRNMNLGDLTIDLTSASGSSLMAAGRPVPQRVLRRYFQRHFPECTYNLSEQYQAYFVPFCANASMASRYGQVNGYQWFDGSKMKLRVTLPAARVREVQTLTLAGGTDNDGGYYVLSFNGELTGPLVYNANVAAMKAALEGLRVCTENQIKVTFSATAAGSFTVTFGEDRNECGKIYEKYGLVQLIPLDLNDGTVNARYSTALTTAGSAGAPASADSTMCCVVYAPVYHNISIDGNGIIRKNKWMP